MSSLATIPLVAHPYISEAETAGLLSRCNANPYRVRGKDSHFFRKNVPIVDQSWHEGGIYGEPLKNWTNNTMTDISKLEFHSGSPRSGNLPPPTGITAVLSPHAFIAYHTTGSLIRTAKYVYFPVPTIRSAPDLPRAIFVMDNGIYVVRRADVFNPIKPTVDFAESEIEAMLGRRAEGLSVSITGCVTFHTPITTREEDQTVEPYVPEDWDTFTVE